MAKMIGLEASSLQTTALFHPAHDEILLIMKT